MPRSSVLLLPLFFASCFYFGPDIGPHGEEPDASRAADQRFASFVDQFLHWHYSLRPVSATADGTHEYDRQLDDVSRAALDARIAGLRHHLRKLLAFDPGALTPDHRADALVLESALRADLLDLEEIRPWERQPEFYNRIVSGGLYTLASLSFDTPAARMSLAAARLDEVPAVLRSARENLSRPPAIHVEVAVEQFEGTRRFLAETLPAAFASVDPAELRARFETAQKRALQSLDEFLPWLRGLKSGDGDSFAIGEDLYRRKLLYDEMVDIPIDALLDRGERHLRETQEQFRRVAGEIAPGRPPEEVLKELRGRHPATGELLSATRSMLDGLKDFCAARLVDLPADAACRVQETPEFRRSLSFASMEIPGPFETVAREAYYNLTLPDPSWDAEKTEQHLAFFNRYSLPIISIHEAYPGHYTQFLAVKNTPTKVRKVFGCASFAEGWAHYCEQLLVDEGYFGAETAPARLMQLSLALQRICRYLAGIRMHCRGLSLEGAVELFQKEGFLERANAEREARRGASDPTYLVYTLGKMEILSLREECRAKWGRDFTLREFHNRFIAHGYPPIRILRSILLDEPLPPRSFLDSGSAPK